MKPNLEQFLRENINKGQIDFSIRASIDSLGNISFYVHPANTGGDTLDFVVNGNKLEQLFVD